MQQRKWALFPLWTGSMMMLFVFVVPHHHHDRSPLMCFNVSHTEHHDNCHHHGGCKHDPLPCSGEESCTQLLFETDTPRKLHLDFSPDFHTGVTLFMAFLPGYRNVVYQEEEFGRSSPIPYVEQLHSALLTLTGAGRSPPAC